MVPWLFSIAEATFCHSVSLHEIAAVALIPSCKAASYVSRYTYRLLKRVVMSVCKCIVDEELPIPGWANPL